MAQKFDNVRVLLGEPDSSLRASIQSTLYTIGIRDIVSCRAGHLVMPALEREPIDVVLCDVDLPGLFFADVVRLIRHGGAGHHPFPIVIATMAKATAEKVQAVVHAGVDDIIPKPLQMDVLTSRLKRFIRMRKPFVATEMYVGPDRRTSVRPDDMAFLMEVPNTLKAKVVDHAGNDAIASLIAKARAELDERKVHNASLALVTLADRVVAFYAGGSDAFDTVRRDIGHLIAHCDGMLRRRADQPPETTAPIQAVREVAKKLSERYETPQVSDVASLGRLGEQIRRQLAHDGLAQAVTEEVV